MSEQSPPPPTPEGPLSPDGQYRWDGSQWQPAAGAAGVPSTKGGIATIWVVLSLVFCFPVGLVFIFLSRWTQKTKLIVAGVSVGLLLLGSISLAAAPKTTTNPSTPSVSASSPTPLSAADKAAADKAAADKAAADKAAADKAAADKAAADKATADKAAADKAAADAAAAAAAQHPPAQTDPYPAATAAGASAVCADGTYSYSKTRSGTCSGHGGVHWWTGNLGPAGPGAH